MNFGGIGVVIGHEIMHAFDDRGECVVNDSNANARTGRLYDKYGNVREWWDNETIAKFEIKAKCIEDQYSSFYIEQAKDSVRC